MTTQRRIYKQGNTMKKPTKKLMIFAMLASLALFSIANATSFPLTLTDDDGASLTLKTPPQRIVVAGGLWPMPSVIIMLENSTDKIVYMPSAAKNALIHSFMAEIFPRIEKIPAGNSENIEELLSYKPDLFICHSSNKAICAMMRKSGVPTLAISVSLWQYNSHKTLEGWLNLLAPVLDKEDKARKILAQVAKQENLAKNENFAPQENLTARQNLIAQNNPTSKENLTTKENILSQNAKSSKPSPKPIESHTQLQKPRAIFIHTYASDEKLVVAGIFGKYLLESSGGIHALDSLRSANTSIEEIYRLNPDIIYINNFSPLLPKQILQSKRWQGIKAVQHKRVYKLPLASYRPFAPSVDLPVLLAWLRAHNSEFVDSMGGAKGTIKQDYKIYAKEYYQEIFGLTLSQSQVEKIFTPQSKAGNLK